MKRTIGFNYFIDQKCNAGKKGLENNIKKVNCKNVFRLMDIIQQSQHHTILAITSKLVIIPFKMKQLMAKNMAPVIQINPKVFHPLNSSK